MLDIQENGDVEAKLAESGIPADARQESEDSEFGEFGEFVETPSTKFAENEAQIV